MSTHTIPGGDRATCLLCDRGLYVFHVSPWPECKGTRDEPHAARAMSPIRPLTKPRPGAPEPTGPRFLDDRVSVPTGLSYAPVSPSLDVVLEAAA